MANRSFHFIPAHKIHLFKKINELNSDHYIFDLEDAVPEELKDLARHNLRDFFKNNSTENCWIRINEAGSKFFSSDLKLLNCFKAMGVVIPKFQINSQAYVALGAFKKILIIEDLKCLNGLAYADLPGNTYGLGLGLEDMLTGFVQTSETLKPLIIDIRLQFVKSVKSHALPVIDGVFTDYQNIDAFVSDCYKSLSYGFDARFSIHPNQISAINENYKANTELAAWANKITELCNKFGSPGYQVIEGVLITPPKLEKAKTILKYLGE